jgi:hypothetical protein
MFSLFNDGSKDILLISSELRKQWEDERIQIRRKQREKYKIIMILTLKDTLNTDLYMVTGSYL